MAFNARRKAEKLTRAGHSFRRDAAALDAAAVAAQGRESLTEWTALTEAANELRVAQEMAHRAAARLHAIADSSPAYQAREIERSEARGLAQMAGGLE